MRVIKGVEITKFVLPYVMQVEVQGIYDLED